MKKIHIFLFTAAVFCSQPIWADSPYKGGMKYTTLNTSNSAAQSIETKGLKQRNIDTPALNNSSEESTETPASAVWNKYKELAAGIVNEPPKAPKEKSVEPPPPESNADEVAATPAAPTGFAAILERYQEKKTKRGQMNSMDVAPPTRPTKPTITTPN